MFADLHYWPWSKSEAPGDSGLGLNNTANFSLFHPHPLLVRKNITQETFLKALFLQLSLYWSGQKPSFRAFASLLSGGKGYHTKMEMVHQMSPLHWGVGMRLRVTMGSSIAMEEKGLSLFPENYCLSFLLIPTNDTWSLCPGQTHACHS